MQYRVKYKKIDVTTDEKKKIKSALDGWVKEQDNPNMMKMELDSIHENRTWRVRAKVTCGPIKTAVVADDIDKMLADTMNKMNKEIEAKA